MALRMMPQLFSGFPKRIASLIVFVLIGWSQLVAQPTWDSLPRLTDHYQQRLAVFEKQKATKGKIVFLGNSITEGGNWRKLLADSSVVNRGISGDVTFGVMKRLDEVLRFKPSKLFLLIGINDLSKGVPEDVVLENIITISAQIRKKSPTTAVFVQSILPVNPGFKNFPKGYALNDQVTTINSQLRKIGKKFGFVFVDIYTPFLDGERLLSQAYSYDGLHLNAAGYLHWIKILKERKHLP